MMNVEIIKFVNLYTYLGFGQDQLMCCEVVKYKVGDTGQIYIIINNFSNIFYHRKYYCF